MTEITNTLEELKLGSISLMSVVNFLLLVLVCFIVIKILMTILGHLLKRSTIELVMQGFIRSVAKVVLWILAFIVIAGRLGIETSSFVAILSVAGLALSLSIQSVLSNLFSGFTIMRTKPFSAGDYVMIDTAEGYISEVGLFYTKLKTLDNKLVYIPNSTITKDNIINYTSEKLRRVDLFFSTAYEDDTKTVRKALLEAMTDDSRVLEDPAPFVGLQEYEDSEIKYVMRAWVNSEDYWPVHYALNESVRDKFDKYGLSMSYPHVNVHMIEK